MAGYLSPRHLAVREQLINELRVHIKNGIGIQAAARKAKMDPKDVSKFLRFEIPASISKVQDLGEAVGLKLVMKWERKDN